MLTVQVLDESGENPLGEPVEVFKKTTLALPAGDYRLRVNGEGRLGRTYRLAVNRRETIDHKISLDEGRLLGRELDPLGGMLQDRPREEPMPFALVTTALELTPGKADIVEFTGKTVIRRDGTTGKAVWDAANPQSPHDPRARSGPLAAPDRSQPLELCLRRTGERFRWRRYTGRARGRQQQPCVPGPLGQGRLDALEPRRRDRRLRRPATGRPRAPGTDPACGPPGRKPRPGRDRGRRQRRDDRPDRHDVLPGIPGGGRAADRQTAHEHDAYLRAAGRPGDLGPVGTSVVDLPDRPRRSRRSKPIIGRSRPR